MPRPSSVLFLFLLLISAGLAPAAEIRRSAEPVANRYIVALPESTMNVDLVASDLAKAYDGRILAVWKHAVKGFWVEVSAQNAEKLAKDRRVKAVEEDAVVHSSASGERNTGVLPDHKAGDHPLWHLRRISHRQPAAAPGETHYDRYRWTNDGTVVSDGPDNGKRAVVYVIDTGVLATHREFTDSSRPFGQGRVEEGFSAATNPGAGSGSDSSVAVDYAPPDSSSSIAPCDSWLKAVPGRALTDADAPVHGTAVASLVTGKNVGVADGATVISVNVMSCGNGPAAAVRTMAMLISGVDWVAGDVDGKNKLAVLTMSTFAQIESAGVVTCSGTNCDAKPAVTLFERAIHRVLDLGVPVVASANNQNADACTGTPARLSRRGGLFVDGKAPRVITVGGTSSDDMRWVRPASEVSDPNLGDRGSNYGQCVDIWAPAARINVAAVTSDIYRSGFNSSGTSYSAPIVAGIIARMLAAEPSLAAVPTQTANLVWQRLAENATVLDGAAKKLGPGSPSRLAYIGGLSFTTQPKSQITSTTSVTLSAAVIAPAGVSATYQWYRSTPGNAIDTAKIGTGAEVTFPCTGPAGGTCTNTDLPGSGDQFWVRVTRSDLTDYTADSHGARITIGSCTVPTIEVQPVSIWAIGSTVGRQLTARVATSPGNAWRYEWQKAIPLFSSRQSSQYTGYAGTDDVTFQEVASSTRTGTADVEALTISQTEEVAYYRLVVWPTATGCSTINPAPSVISETVQVRVCQRPTVANFSVTELDYNMLSGDPIGTTVTNATTYTWLFSVTSGGPYLPLRMNYPDGTWETFHESTLRPPKKGYYKLRAENSCDSDESDNEVYVKSVKDFDLLGDVFFSNGTQLFGLPVSAGLIAGRAPIRVGCGDLVRLQIYPRTGGTGLALPFRRALDIQWPAGLQATKTLFDRDTVTVRVSGRTEIVVTATDPLNDPGKQFPRSITFTLDGPQGQTCECTHPASSFTVMPGQCALPRIPNPYIPALSNGLIIITPWVVDNSLNDLPRAEFDFSWKITRPDNTTLTSVGGALLYTIDPAAGAGSHWVEVTARRRSNGECATGRIEVRPFGACSGAACRVGCIRRAVRVNGTAAEAFAATTGQSLVLSPDNPATGETYEWYRSSDSVAEEKFHTGPEQAVTVTVNGPAQYWVVTTNQDEEIDISAPVRVIVDGAGGSAVAHPPTQIVPAGALVTITATIPGVDRLPTTTYEWRRGNSGDTSTPVIGNDAELRLHNIADDAKFWCRITHNGQTYDTNTASVAVTCTTITGIIHTLPSTRNITRTEFPHLTAAGTGKLLVYTWSRRLPNEATGTFAGIGPAIRPTITAPVTLFSVSAEDACGKTTSFGEVAINLCVPTIDTNPLSQTVQPDVPFTLSVAATPAIDGQPLTVKWYRASDTGRTTHLSETDTLTLSLPASVTQDSFVAVVTYLCDGTAYTLESAPAVIDVCAYPTVTSTSQPSITGPNQQAVLGVEASGRGTMTYQWYRWDVSPGGTRTPTLLQDETTHYLVVSPSTNTDYFCRVTADGTCTTDGPDITVKVCSSPGITTPPLSQTIFSGKTAPLSVTASAGTNTAPLQYQWYQQSGGGDWTAVSGATSPSFTTGTLTAQTAYRVHVSAGACTTVSDAAVISMCTYPEVVDAVPAETLTAVGEQVTLQVPVISPVYDKIVRWYEGESGTGSAIAGGYLNAPLTVSPTATKKYWAEFEYGGCTSRTTTYTVRVCKPAITAQPTGTSVTAGTAVTLTVGTTALAGQTFQWYTGTPGTPTSPVTGATSASLTVTPSSTTTYWVRVTGTCGVSADSGAATVTVCVPPSISAFTGPVVDIRAGESTVLAVTASGSDLSYQWYTGALGVTTSPVPNSNWQNLTVSPSATTSYWVKVTSIGLCSTNTSRVVTVAVCNPPSFSTQPQSQKSFSGKAVTLTAAASSTSGAVTYQWYTGTSGNTGSPIANATSASLTVSPTATTSYWVRATSSICTTDSATATITMGTYSEVVNAAPADTQIAYGGSVTLSLPVMSPVYDKMVTWYRGASGDKTNPVAGPAINGTYTTPALTATTQYWAEFSEGGCTSRTTTYTVSVCRPAITSQPQNVTIAYGQSATVSVGTTPIVGQTYQWYVGAPGNTSSPVAGATSASLTVAPGATTSGWVRVTGTCGISADSDPVTITVCRPPTISSYSDTRYIQAGQSTAIGLTATGTNLSHQWYQGASGVTTNPVPGGTTAAISVSPSSTTSYWVKVTSEGLCTTNGPAITVDVCTTPAITAQPQSQTIRTGSAATLSVATSSSGATYQWYTGPAGTTSSPISGATSASLTVSPTSDTQYWARVTRGACTADSAAATITVCNLTATVASANISSGQSTTLTATMSGYRASPYYIWYRGNSGDTSVVVDAGYYSQQLTVTPAATTSYWVRVTDGTCTYDSATATVSVCIPVITAQPQSGVVNSGSSTTLSISATGAPLTYQWYSVNADGLTSTAISGATGTTYTTPGLTTTARYWVRVSGCQTRDSDTATITICTPPSITAQPSISTSRSPGNPGTITIGASGTNLTYQWYRGQSGDMSQPISGATSSVYSFTLSTSAYYWVRVGACGSYVNSSAVMYSVAPAITTQPSGALVPPNTTATLTVAASGTYLSYQWYQGNSGVLTNPISGANAATYVTPGVTGTTSYWCKVTSGTDGLAYSNAATIGLCTGPQVTQWWAQYGGWNSWYLTVSIGQQDVGNVKVQWYTGTPGNVAQSTPYGDIGPTFSRNIYATAPQTWWVRVWYNNNSCYSDTGGQSTYPVE